MFDLFLSSTNKKKMMIITLITQQAKETCNINEINFLLEDKKKLKRYITMLEEDIKEIFPTIPFFYLIDNDGYISLSNIPLDIIPSLKFYYLNQSTVFHLCYFFCLHTDVSMNQLLDAGITGRSNLYTNLQTLKKILDKFELSISKKKNLYSLDGDEITIRLFQYLFFSRCFSKQNWPFNFSKNFIENQLPPNITLKTNNSTYKHDFLILNAMLYNRYCHNKILSSDWDMIPLFNIITDKKENDLFKKLLSNYPVETENSLINSYFSNPSTEFMEQIVYNFFIFFLFPEVSHPSIYSQKGQSIIENPSTIFTLIDTILKTIHKEFSFVLPDECRNEIIYKIFLHIILVSFLEKGSLYFLMELSPDFISDSYQLFTNPNDIRIAAQKNIKNMLHKILYKNKNFFEQYTIQNKTLFLNYLTTVITHYKFAFMTKKIEKLTIYIDLDRHHISESYYKKKILELFRSHVKITSNFKDADIIICKTYLTEYSTEKTNIININNIFDSTQFNKAASTLHDYIIKYSLID